jgi:hypothetical protein
MFILILIVILNDFRFPLWSRGSPAKADSAYLLPLISINLAQV